MNPQEQQRRIQAALAANARKSLPSGSGAYVMTNAAAIKAAQKQGAVNAVMNKSYSNASAQPVQAAPQAQAYQGTGYAQGGSTAGRAVYDPVAAAAAAANAAANARKGQLRSEGSRSLDELYNLYEEIKRQIEGVGRDNTNRINQEFDGKVKGQVEDMNNGMYDVDVSAAAGNLADSSFRSFDRGKVRTAADNNIKTLNDSRGSSLAEVGSMVQNNMAKYNADQQGITRTRQALNQSQDVNELQQTANTLDATKRGVSADKAKFSTQGQFGAAASRLGNYDTSALESTLKAVVANASASSATKQSTINDILNGTAASDDEKNKLRNKYTQTV